MKIENQQALLYLSCVIVYSKSKCIYSVGSRHPTRHKDINLSIRRFNTRTEAKANNWRKRKKTYLSNFKLCHRGVLFAFLSKNKQPRSRINSFGNSQNSYLADFSFNLGFRNKLKGID